ncbi:N4-gp56 family major capsid protein [Selenomonas sp.]|uniref:N4-gp56 family major capsid protein n=1 Tax=Selenomonas sp. TaxID=2053611 RepID=UPI0025D24F64|nr:N4-gp56 family major capsid protein [Selenomonas sp.]MCI6283443.1 N4-gp56 family major capsid protein [Selenomonas sp.]
MANTTITVAPNLVQEAWAKATWSAGIHKAFFDKFTGTDAGSIIQVKEELKKDKGDSINIPLLMPLTGAGITGDNMLEGNEEALIYRDFSVSIDQLRNAVRLQGKMDEQKTQINMRQDAKTALSDWLATKVDKMIFTALTTDPTANRVVYGGSAASEAAIAAGDKFTVDLIGKAKRMAMEDENTMVKPVRIDGVDTYVMVIDQWQARDLMADTKWIEAQEHANIRGEKNPIFTGALGMYNGVVVHQCNRIPRTETGASSCKVGHALFLGAQAAVMAVGAEPEWNEDTFDYKNQVGFEFGRIFGIAKSQFKYDGTNLTDFGCINVLTSSVDD